MIRHRRLTLQTAILLVFLALLLCAGRAACAFEIDFETVKRLMEQYKKDCAEHEKNFRNLEKRLEDAKRDKIGDLEAEERKVREQAEPFFEWCKKYPGEVIAPNEAARVFSELTTLLKELRAKIDNVKYLDGLIEPYFKDQKVKLEPCFRLCAEFAETYRDKFDFKPPVGVLVQIFEEVERGEKCFPEDAGATTSRLNEYLNRRGATFQNFGQLAAGAVPLVGSANALMAGPRKPPIEIELSSYIRQQIVRNNTGRDLVLVINEYIDGEPVRTFDTTAPVSKVSDSPPAWRFTPAEWPDAKSPAGQETPSVPRTDRSGRHTYRIVVTEKDGKLKAEKSVDFLVEEKVLNVARVRQEGSLWCWAASGQAILNYQGRAIYACDLVNIARRGQLWPWSSPAVDCCKEGPTGEGCDFGLGASAILSNQNTYDVLKQEGFSATVSEGALEQAAVTTLIQGGNPFMVGVKNHFAVVRGYRNVYEGTAKAGSYRTYLHVMDPLIYPHYVLTGHGELRGGKYLGQSGYTWVVSITDIRPTTPIADKSGWIDVPKSAIAGIPFEARLQGLSDDSYEVMWNSRPAALRKLREHEQGRASEWEGSTPGTAYIGARVYADNTRKNLVSEKQPKAVQIVPAPTLDLMVGYSRDPEIVFAADNPDAGKPLTLRLRLVSEPANQPVTVDVEKMNLLPHWHGTDDKGNTVSITPDNDLLGPKIGKGQFEARFTPSSTDRTYTLWATLEVPGKKVIATSRKVRIVYAAKKPATEKKPEATGDGQKAGQIGITPSSKEVMATEIIDFAATVPDSVKAWAKGYKWSGPVLSESTDHRSVKMQFGPMDAGKYTISVTADGASPDGETARGEAAITVKAASFAGTGSDLWEGGAHTGGFHVKRKPVIRKRKNPDNFMSNPGKVVDSGNVTATLSVAWKDSFVPKTDEELRKSVEGSTLWTSLPERAPHETELKPFALGDFKGYILEVKKVASRYGGSEYRDLGFPAAGVAGRGLVKKGNVCLEITYTAYGSGVLIVNWSDDMPFLQGEVAAAWGEIRSMLGSLRIVADGKFTRYPHPVVKLSASPDPSRKYRIGEPITLRATVENPPPGADPKTFVYSWTGHIGSGDTITLNPVKPGRQQISVAVAGIGSASLDIDVEAIKAVIVKTSPTADTIPVGSKATLSARLTSGGQEVTGKYIYRWQPNTEVGFDAAEGPENRTTATFKRPGKTRLWVDVLMKEGEALTTVARSENLDLDIVEPKLSLTVEPTAPMVGQEVSVKVSSQVPVEDMDFRWEVSGSAKTLRESQDTREIVIRLLDDKPVTVTVRGRAKHTGDGLGEAKHAMTAKKYAVHVTGPKAMGPKPTVWKEGAGLVDLENAIAADQIVEFAADTQPVALTGPVKYQWSVSGGSCTVSNRIVREARVTASAAGGCELAVVIKDKNDVPLGEGKGRFDATVTRETIAAGQKKAKDVADAKTKLADAKGKARKGDYDGAIKDAEEAGKLDPANKEAAATAQKLRQEKETIHQQIGKAKKLMDENRFADAQKELIVASNLNGYYQPVQQANQELGTRWNKYNSEVRDKVYEVRSANEKKDFGKALEVAAAWRASTKLDPYAEKELKQQEDWAKQWKAQKDKQIGILKAGGEKVKNYDYAGALKTYDEGFANGQNIYNGSEPEYKEAVELRGQAFTKNKRLNELIPWVQRAAESKESMPAATFENGIKSADEAIALQPNNEQLKKWREQIVARLEKTKADNDRTAAGRKHLDAARLEENTYLSQLSGTQGRQGQWGEKLEEDMQLHITKAIENYRASLQYIPDANLEKKIKELEATLEGRKKYLENYRLSTTLKNEADALAQQAMKDPDIQSAAPKYDEAIEKYRKSLALYRPFNAESTERQMWNLEYYKHERWVKKYWADGQAVEKEGKIVEAISVYDKAIASFHPTVPQNDRMYIIVHQQDLKNRVNGAKNWRADGEAKQKAGKIPEAIASYKQSLALFPDAALAEHVRMLEGRQAEAGDKKAAADKLWQEGTTLFNQGRPSDALSKFKESLGYYTDATRTKYVADMEARRVKAVALREEGAKLQQGNRIPEAIAKYKESLSYWPDTGLSSHIATLEGKLKQDNDTATRKARAKQLRDEGYALQQKNQLQAAVGKYKESLAVWPDKQLEDYIRQLEAKIAAVPPVVTPTTPAPPVTTPSTTSYDGTYGGTVSGASTGTVQFTVSGISVTGTVSGKYGQDAYRATLSGTLDRSTGEFSTKLAGDVTGTSFQGGLKGRIQGSSASGDWHARNQYGNPTGTWQASRGSSRQTQTTAAEAAVSTAAINIVGRWKTEALESGKVIDVNYTTFNRDGSYTMDVSPESLGGTAVCTVRGSYTLSGQTLNLKPQGSQCKFNDGTTRSEPADRYDTITGKISGSDRSFTYEPPGTGVTVRYTRQ